MTWSTYAPSYKCEDFTKLIHDTLQKKGLLCEFFTNTKALRNPTLRGFAEVPVSIHLNNKNNKQKEGWSISKAILLQGHNFSYKAFIWLNILCFQFRETTPWSASFVSMVTRDSQQEFVSSVKPYIWHCIASSHLSATLWQIFQNEPRHSENKRAARTSFHLHMINPIIKSKSQGRVMAI